MNQPANTTPWTFIDGLAESYAEVEQHDPPHHYNIPRADDERAKPKLNVLERVDGARIVRIAFRPGDTFADHSAPAPILIMGQAGNVDVSIGDDTVQLHPGSVVHIAAHQVHSLTTSEPATVTLIILSS